MLREVTKTELPHTASRMLSRVRARPGLLARCDRCVTTLRAKIEPIPRSPRYIQTIRDIGYRFESE